MSADCTTAIPLQLQSLLALAFTLAGAAVLSHIRYCCAAIGDQIGGISTALLSRHKDHCRAMSDSLQARYQTVLTTLQRKPRTIEEVVQLEEYVKAVDADTAPLREGIAEMVACNDLLDDFGYQARDTLLVGLEHSNHKWLAVGWPQRIQQQCQDSSHLAQACRAAFGDEMGGDQDRFARAIELLDMEVSQALELSGCAQQTLGRNRYYAAQCIDLLLRGVAAVCVYRVYKQVAGFEQHEDATMVDRVAKLVSDVSAKLEDAESKARLFNAREALFGREITDYDCLARVRKALEPYANLWTTARDWAKLSNEWRTGSFLAIDAEKLEADVERCAIAIGKAARYFDTANLQNQSKIAADVKDSVAAFRPKVPIIVALRNPGMRARHWEALSEKI
eukprot:12722-Heterococcus_DN1.PRE.1